MSEQTGAALGTYTWVEFGVPDLEAASRFYSAVFGWKLESFAEGYAVATIGGRNIGGFYQQADPVPDGVRVYVEVADLEGTLETVVAEGGTAGTGRTPVTPDKQWWADFRDPFGTLVGILTSNPAAG